MALDAASVVAFLIPQACLDPFAALKFDGRSILYPRRLKLSKFYRASVARRQARRTETMPTDQAPRNRLFVQSFKLICGLNFISNRATAFCADVYRVRSRRISIISAAGRTEASAPCGKTARTTKAAPSRINLARARPLKTLANFIYTLASVYKLAQYLRSTPKWVSHNPIQNLKRAKSGRSRP